MNEVANLMMQPPIPGESLTNDPKNPKPFETPPRITSYEEGIEYLSDKLIDPVQSPKILEMARQGFPLSELAGMILIKGFMDGLWNPDMILLLIEPAVYMLMFICEMGQVRYVLHKDQAMMVGEDDKLRLKQIIDKKSQNADVNKIKSKLPAEVIARGEEVLRTIDLGVGTGGGLLAPEEDIPMMEEVEQ